MTTLTLDQAKTIVFSASTAYEALAHLRDAGCNVVVHFGDCYSVHCGELDIISFTQLPNSKFMSVAVGVHFFSLEQRKAFLESQQQPTDTVPAVSIAVEARPSAPLIEDDSPTFKFLVSIMPITDLGGVFQDSDYEHAVYKRLEAQAAYLSQKIGRPATVYELSLECVLAAIKAVSDEIENADQLSTETVDNSPTELNVYCPSCDYHSATAIMSDPEDPFYHVNCSQCGLDADREKVFLSPSGLQPQ